ncbi:hypothetical protein SLA2020_461870 [Shorea laevis]
MAIAWPWPPLTIYAGFFRFISIPWEIEKLGCPGLAGRRWERLESINKYTGDHGQALNAANSDLRFSNFSALLDPSSFPPL